MLLLDSSKCLSDCSNLQRRILRGSCNPLRCHLYLAGEGTPQWELLAGSLGNARQGHIVLPKALRARSGQRLLIHARDRDFAQRASREQRLRDVQAIGGSRHGLTTSSREIQPALSLSWFPERRVPRNRFAPRLGATLAPSGGNPEFW